MFDRFNIRHFLIVSYIVIGVIGVLLWQIGTALKGPFPGQIFEAPAGLEKEEIVFSDAQGITLSGWLFKGEAGKGVILILHGLGIDKSVVAQRAPFLVEAGYTVFVFDFQGHGASEGERITYGYEESHNVRAALSFLNNRYPDEKLAIIAPSMGGAALLVKDHVIHGADAYVLEGVYSSLSVTAENRLVEILGEPSRILSSIFLTQVWWRLGFDHNLLRPIDEVGTLRAPVFVIGGGEDTYTTVEETRAIYDAVTAPKDFWIVEDVAHKDFYMFSKELYEKKVLAFLEKHIGYAEAD